MLNLMRNLLLTAAGFLVAFLLPQMTFGSKSETQKGSEASRLFVASIGQIANQKLTTHKGREFTLLVGSEGREPVRNRFLVQSGLHGNEADTSQFVLWLAERYAKGKSLLNRLPGTGVDFLPYANPDGSIAGSRYNAAGVNLNRNFNILWGVTDENPGKKAFSEPETKAIQALFRAREYTAAVDVHGYINWIVGPSGLRDMGRVLQIDKGKEVRYEKWSKALKKRTNQLANYKYKTAAGLGDGGAFEDWAFWQENVFAYCLEMVADRSFFNPQAQLQMAPSFEGDKKFHHYEQFIHDMFESALAIDSENVSH